MEWIAALEAGISLTSEILSVVKWFYDSYKTYKHNLEEVKALDESVTRVRLFIQEVQMGIKDKTAEQQLLVANQIDLINKVLKKASKHINTEKERSKVFRYFLASRSSHKFKELADSIDRVRQEIASSLVAIIQLALSQNHTALTYQIDSIITTTQATQAGVNLLLKEAKATTLEVRKLQAQMNTMSAFHCPDIVTGQLRIDTAITDTVKYARYFGDKVVVKYLPVRNTDELKRDLQKAYELSYKYLVQIYGIAYGVPTPEETRPAIVMERLQGDLHDLLHMQKIPLSWSKKALMGKEIASGLYFLHKNEMLHRNVAPKNILVDSEYHCKLSGYGIAKPFNNARSIGTIPKGLPAYRAPELKAQNREYTFKTDIYAFGIVLWEICTQIVPGEGLSDQQILAKDVKTLCPLPQSETEMPSEFRKIITDCTDENAENRCSLKKARKRLEEIIAKYSLQESNATLSPPVKTTSTPVSPVVEATLPLPPVPTPAATIPTPQ